MATYEDLGSITVEASTDLSSNQFFLVSIDSSGQLALSGAGDTVAGVLTNKPDAAGKAGSVQVLGVAKVVAGAAITAGADVEADAAGKAITETTNPVIGIALESASGANEIIKVLLTHEG